MLKRILFVFLIFSKFAFASFDDYIFDGAGILYDFVRNREIASVLNSTNRNGEFYVRIFVIDGAGKNISNIKSEFLKNHKIKDNEICFVVLNSKKDAFAILGSKVKKISNDEIVEFIDTIFKKNYEKNAYTAIEALAAWSVMILNSNGISNDGITDIFRVNEIDDAIYLCARKGYGLNSKDDNNRFKFYAMMVLIILSLVCFKVFKLERPFS